MFSGVSLFIQLTNSETSSDGDRKSIHSRGVAAVVTAVTDYS